MPKLDVSPNHVAERLATLVPAISIETDTQQHTLILEGPVSALEQARERLDQLDKPLDQVVLECKFSGNNTPSPGQIQREPSRHRIQEWTCAMGSLEPSTH